MNLTQKLIKEINDLRRKEYYNRKHGGNINYLKIRKLKNNCIIVTSHKVDWTKYPRIYFHGGYKKVSRLICEFEMGNIHNKKVLHKCNNPKCINITHLYLGTQKDNALDMVNSNRQAKGEKSGVCKLNNKKVKEIRKLSKVYLFKRYVGQYKKNKIHKIRKHSVKKLSKKYKISIEMIYCVIKNKNWKHIK